MTRDELWALVGRVLSGLGADSGLTLPEAIKQAALRVFIRGLASYAEADVHALRHQARSLDDTGSLDLLAL